MVKRHKIWLWLGAGTFVLIGCQSKPLPETAYPLPSADLSLATSPLPSPTNRDTGFGTLSYPYPDSQAGALTPVPTHISTVVTPSPTVTPPPTPSQAPGIIPEFNPLTLLAPAILQDPHNDALHNLILFDSRSSDPFPSPNSVGFRFEGAAWYFDAPILWAISPDGQTAGYLTSDMYNAAFWLSSDPLLPNLFVNYELFINHSSFRPVVLPPECDHAPQDPPPCHHFGFSPSGNYLGLRYENSPGCGPGVMIINPTTGYIFLKNDFGHFYSFLPNHELLPIDEVLLGSGHCEGGNVAIFNPEKGAMFMLGAEPVDGTLSQNGAGTFLVGRAHDYAGVESEIWAYNRLTQKVYLSARGVIEQNIWAPDGVSLIFQQAEMIHQTDAGDRSYGPVRIYVVEPNGSRRLLAASAEYNFYLCEKGGECHWYGDWIPLRRTEVDPQRQTILYGDISPCFSDADECPTPPELFALNYRTGELIPWEEFTPPPSTPTPTPLPLGPDLSSRPVYTHSSGQYAFYVGLDGHSLWLVPQTGEPVLWVKDGAHFTYIP